LWATRRPPIVAEPGARWIYSGGAVALLGKLIADGTGKSLPEFAREGLFAALAIDSFEWAAGPDGTPSAASGLRLRGARPAAYRPTCPGARQARRARHQLGHPNAYLA
jgi:CubicO group peptidase (beta-lactamase class C family)